MINIIVICIQLWVGNPSANDNEMILRTHTFEEIINN